MDDDAVGPPLKLAIVEVLDRDNHTRQVVPVARWPVTIGRAVDCDLVLDDPYVAAHHATLDEIDGALMLIVGESVNGAQLQVRHLKASERAPLSGGEVSQLGGTRLRLRRAADAIAPEREFLREPVPGRIPLVLLLLGLGVWN